MPAATPPALPVPVRAFVAAAPDAVLCLDFDGSLAPIVDDPAAARILPAARDALGRLVPRLAGVLVVSGRPAAFLADGVAVPGVTYAGVYGLERWVDGRTVADPGAAPFASAVAAAAAEAEAGLPGVTVERKGALAFTLHWRTAPAAGEAARAWAGDAAVRHGLRLVPGRMAVELRPPIAVDKGTTVAAFAAGRRAAAFAGDDAGDLPAFAELGRLVSAGMLAAALTIGVASAEAPPVIDEQDVVVEGPAGLAALLHAVADTLDTRA